MEYVGLGFMCANYFLALIFPLQDKSIAMSLSLI
jgi:hypothetical protein